MVAVDDHRPFPAPRRRVVLLILVGVVAVCGLRREQDPFPQDDLCCLGASAEQPRRLFQADHPVPGHRPAPRLVAEAALDAVRVRISELSLKQHE